VLAAGYDLAGRTAVVNAAARHFGWTERQRAAELMRHYRRDIEARRPARQIDDHPRPRAVRPRARSVRTSPRAANAPPTSCDPDPDPEPPRVPALPLREVERHHHRDGGGQHQQLGGDVHRDWRAQRLADDIALFAAIRKFLDEPTIPGRLLQREEVDS
jgi:hypothetical protein